MLYQIDESCLAVLKTKNSDAIAFFEQLALDRRKCKNIIIADRGVFAELAQTGMFSSLVREIYRKLGNRVSENRLILKKTKKYCRIIASDTEPRLETEGEHEVLLLPIEVGASRDFTSESIMLAENEEEISFYKIIGQYYMKQNEIGNINILFEEQNGGGSTISKVLQKRISEKNRMCFCIVDSDKKFRDASCGDTMGKVLAVIEGVEQVCFEVMLLEVQEVENLIPLSILEVMADVYKFNTQGIEFMKLLVSGDGTKYCPAFYFDLKKGIPRSAYIITQDASEEQRKKYRRSEAYRLYWKGYIETFGIKIEETGQDSAIIDGICEKILKHTLEYWENLKRKGMLDKVEIGSYLWETWMSIGEKVYCWGCVGSRIAV